MNLLSSINNKAEYVYKNLSGNVGTMLLVTGAVGWALSSLAHVFAIIINKKIDKDQKAFLVPQEMADAAVNIALFIVVTRSFTKFGENLVKRGKFITKEIAEYLEKDPFAKKLGEKVTSKIESVVKKSFQDGFEKQIVGGYPEEIITKDVTKKLEIPDLSTFKSNEEFQDKYYKFFDGVSFISSTIGSIISCNLLTPYFRNLYAAKKQKFDMGKMTPIDRPTLPAVSRTGMDDFRQKVINRPNITSSASMKI